MLERSTTEEDLSVLEGKCTLERTGVDARVSDNVRDLHISDMVCQARSLSRERAYVQCS